MKDIRDNKSKIYTKWRYSVFVRDAWKCQHCGSEDNLHAHHIIGWEIDENLRYEVKNGLTLCSSCHTKLHNIGRTAWNKGKKLDETGRKRLSESHKGQVSPNKGRKASPETIAKQRAAKLGKKRQPHSEEHKRKIGLANRETLARNSALRKGKALYICPSTGKRTWIDKV